MTSIEIDVDRAAVRRALQGPDGVAPRYLNRKSRQVTFAARAKAPVGRTGNLARSIRSTTVRSNGDTARIRVGAFALSNNGRDYSIYVSKGTTGPIVSPRGKPMGPFQPFGSGRVGSGLTRFGTRRTRNLSGPIYAYKVRGQAAQNFLFDALSEVAAADPALRIIRAS